MVLEEKWMGISRRQFMAALLASVAASGLGGCGTILHPERRGQPAGRLDWKIVALDGLGLLFFFIPGVIAFAVDFATGAIYLPPSYLGSAQPTGKPQELVAVNVRRDELTQSKIEQVVSTHAGREVRLLPGEYETAELGDVGQFWTKHEAMIAAKAASSS